jgi:cytochrome c556
MLTYGLRKPPKVIPMKKIFATLLGASLVSVLAACGGGGGGAEIPDTPEGRAFEFRHGVMEAVAFKVTRLRAMAMGEIPANDAAFAKDARDVAALAGMIPEGFIPDSVVGPSIAKPDIWTNKADFDAKAAEFQRNAEALAMTASAQGFEAAKGMVQAVGGGCGNCHRPYRASREE